MLSEELVNQKTKISRLTPEDIDTKILKGLLAYISGEITDTHLIRILKQQLVGNSTKLSFKIVELLPEFNKIINLLDRNGVNHNDVMETIDDILEEVINKN